MRYHEEINDTVSSLVCVNVLQKFVDYAGEDTSDIEKSEVALKAFCKTLTGKDDRFVC